MSVRRLPPTKDRDSETFWRDYDLILSVTKQKANNNRIQARKIRENLSNPVSLTKINTILQKYFYDIKSDQLFLCSQSADEINRKCLTETKLRSLVAESHLKDHRKGVTIYQDLRHFYYPLNRSYIVKLTQEYISKFCPKCKLIEKKQVTVAQNPCKKSVVATYPNSRWQADLKKMPNYKGFNRVLNIVDIFSRFAFGAALKSKKVSLIAILIFTNIYFSINSIIS